MTWDKGQSGNPEGRRREKVITDQLRIVLNEPCAKDKKIKKIRLLAEALVDEALSGNVQAMKEVIDRIEGKSPQEHEHDHQHTHRPGELSESAEWLTGMLRNGSSLPSKKPVLN
ncbi:MAG: DUF5681 domain-containing protein [Gammaproteobacteria bacterium]